MRGTPVARSTSTTLSAGTRPVAIHREIDPCDLNPIARANAVWPPTRSHANRIACLLMGPITAQIVNTINAYSGSRVQQAVPMGKTTESPPSPFWQRLTDAWAPLGLPTSQNGVATKLGMSQGSTRRWYTGDGLPETEIIKEIARLGNVTIDWLLLERMPRSPISPKTQLGKLLLLWEQLDDAGREHLHRTALGELALKPPASLQPDAASAG